jgi:hypothetical protein
VQWRTPVISATWEEGSSRPDWAKVRETLYIIIIVIMTKSWKWWYTRIIPAIQGVKVEGSWSAGAKVSDPI